MPSNSWSDFSAKVKNKSKLNDQKEKEVTSKSSSISSFSDLKASLKKSSNNNKEELLGKREKKLSPFQRPSPNVAARSSKHDEKEKGNSSSNKSHRSDDQSEKIKSALERKAKLYDQLQRGKTGGLSEERFQDSLVDWNRKEAQRLVRSSDEEEDEQDRNAENNHDQHQANNADDPLVEYEDEFGRTRTVRKSELPRHIHREQQKAEENSTNDHMVTYGPSTTFPVYKPGPAQRAREMVNKEGVGSYKRSAADHFDSRSEKRYRGAGFFQFSQDEEVRKRQMDELHEERKTTQKHRSGLDGRGEK